VRTLTTEAVVNESGDPALLLKRAERQIKELKQELAMRDMLRWGVAMGEQGWMADTAGPVQQQLKLWPDSSGACPRARATPLLTVCHHQHCVPHTPTSCYRCLSCACSGRARVNYDDLSEAEQQELQQLVARFLAGQVELEALPIDSIKHIRDTYKAFKAIAAAGGFSVGGAADAGAAASSRHATRVSDRGRSITVDVSLC
jgi:hypothetical protein